MAETIEHVGLTEKADVARRQLSGGQLRRLDVALALVGDPELLFLDEPTTGFDPSARRQAWEVIASLRDLGKTVFLTTHYMDEAQRLADRVAIIVGGRIVAEGPPDRIGRGAAASEIRFRLPGGIEPAAVPVTGDRARRQLCDAADERARAGAARADRLGAGARLELDGLEVGARASRTSTSRSPRTGG